MEALKHPKILNCLEFTIADIPLPGTLLSSVFFSAPILISERLGSMASTTLSLSSTCDLAVRSGEGSKSLTFSVTSSSEATCLRSLRAAANCRRRFRFLDWKAKWSPDFLPISSLLTEAIFKGLAGLCACFSANDRVLGQSEIRRSVTCR